MFDYKNKNYITPKGIYKDYERNTIDIGCENHEHIHTPDFDDSENICFTSDYKQQIVLLGKTYGFKIVKFSYVFKDGICDCIQKSKIVYGFENIKNFKILKDCQFIVYGENGANKYEYIETADCLQVLYVRPVKNVYSVESVEIGLQDSLCSENSCSLNSSHSLHSLNLYYDTGKWELIVKNDTEQRVFLDLQNIDKVNDVYFINHTTILIVKPGGIILLRILDSSIVDVLNLYILKPFNILVIDNSLYVYNCETNVYNINTLFETKYIERFVMTNTAYKNPYFYRMDVLLNAKFLPFNKFIYITPDDLCFRKNEYTNIVKNLIKYTNETRKVQIMPILTDKFDICSFRVNMV